VLIQLPDCPWNFWDSDQAKFILLNLNINRYIPTLGDFEYLKTAPWNTLHRLREGQCDGAIAGQMLRLKFNCRIAILPLITKANAFTITIRLRQSTGITWVRCQHHGITKERKSIIFI